MSNVLLAYANAADSATLTAGGTWSLSIDNVQTADKSEVARTATDAVTDTWFRGDLGDHMAVRLLGLLATNTSDDALYRVRLTRAPLWIDLTTVKLDPRLTVTRGTERTYIGSNGLRQTAAINEWPLEYNPITLAVRGRINWNAKTNYWLQSGDQSNASTTKTNCTITSNAATGAGGTATMDKIVEASGAGIAPALRQDLSVTSGQLYSLSADVMAGERGFVLFTFGSSGFGSVIVACLTLATGAITTNGAGSGVQTQAVQLPSGKWRFSLTAAATANSGPAIQIKMADQATTSSSYTYTGDGASGLYVDAIQFEDGLPSPYIPTTTASVTRNFDQVRVTSLTGIYSSGSVTLACKYMPAHIGARPAAGHLLSLSAGSTSNVIRLFRDSTGTAVQYNVSVANVTQAGTTINTGAALALESTQWAVVSAATDNFRASAGGVAVSTDTSGSLPTVTMLEVGCVAGSTTSNAECWLQEIAVIPEGQTSGDTLSISTSGLTAVTDEHFSTGWLTAAQMVFHGAVPEDWARQYGIWALPATVPTARYFEVELQDTGNADGYWEIGRLWAGTALQPAKNITREKLQHGRTELSTVETTPAGKRFAAERARPRWVRFALDWLTEAEGDELHEMEAAVGTTGEVVFILDPADAARSQRYSVHGSMRELSPLENPFLATTAKAFHVEEEP